MSDATTVTDSARARLSTKLIDNFAPAYFVSVMGTGITSLILFDFPYPARWLRICSYIMYAITALCFASTSTMAAMCLKRNPNKWTQWHTLPDIAPFLGAFPMGYTTLVNFTWNLVNGYRHGAVGILVMWLIAVALSVYTATIVMFRTYFMKKEGAPSLHHSKLHSLILMPLVPLTVVASLGNLFALALPTLALQISTLVATYILWANALVLAFMVLTIHTWKLLIHRIPPTNLIFSLFLPVGFLGQGSFGIVLLGHNIWQLCLANAANNPNIGHYLKYAEGNVSSETLLIVGHIFMLLTTMAGAFLVSAGYVMVAFAVAQCLSKTRPFAKRPNPQFTDPKFGLIKFGRGYWGITFPLGTVSLGSTELGKVLGPGFQFFTAMGAIFGVGLTLVTITCLLGLIYRGVQLCQSPKDDAISKV